MLWNGVYHLPVWGLPSTRKALTNWSKPLESQQIVTCLERTGLQGEAEWAGFVPFGEQMAKGQLNIVFHCWVCVSREDLARFFLNDAQQKDEENESKLHQGKFPLVIKKTPPPPQGGQTLGQLSPWDSEGSLLGDFQNSAGQWLEKLNLK